MRTTVDVDPELLQAAKKQAADRHATLSVVVEDALRESFARRESGRRAGSVTLTADRSRGGLRPAVDLDNNAALLDVMDDSL